MKMNARPIISTQTPITSTQTPITSTLTPVTQTPNTLKPKIYEEGPYIVRNTGQQQMCIRERSLKCVELLMQTNMSEIQPACSPLPKTSFEGWKKQLQRQAPFKGRRRRDASEILGTGSGIINRIDSEMNK